ncbi:endonuclease/exonuclease/phosphatase family protein [Actinomadura sp. NPDC047616]|uniref:endonuclease/exonuclease/phosphatase family protein n=1 Tax=Actinomadura sp. NPDC047616 TaxID=3155914 RepID=UPI0033CC0CC4
MKPLQKEPLTLITYNLKGSPKERERELADLAHLGKYQPDVVGIQEAKYWERDHDGHVTYEQLHAAEHALGMRGFLVESQYYGCHLATFIREPRIEVIERHDVHNLRFHVEAGLRCIIDGHTIDLVNVHFAPSSPKQRVIEAELLKLRLGRRRYVIVFGDFNAMGDNDPKPDPEGIDPGHYRQKTDTSPAATLRRNGLIDVGGRLGDSTPTVGHDRADRLKVRIDRFHTDLPEQCFDHHEVLQIGGSDHKPVLVRIALDQAPRRWGEKE